ncbi:hypothetical protein BBP40_001293 [Aspergillus hancockii]|nr:hypothetical protein BBP40_001293 [Aspergillus hancockii]
METPFDSPELWTEERFAHLCRRGVDTQMLMQLGYMDHANHSTFAPNMPGWISIYSDDSRLAKTPTADTNWSGVFIEPGRSIGRDQESHKGAANTCAHVTAPWSRCSTSAAVLKSGIEQRLQPVIPEGDAEVLGLQKELKRVRKQRMTLELRSDSMPNPPIGDRALTQSIPTASPIPIDERPRVNERSGGRANVPTLPRGAAYNRSTCNGWMGRLRRHFDHSKASYTSDEKKITEAAR